MRTIPGVGSSRIPRFPRRCSILPQTRDSLEDFHTPRTPASLGGVPYPHTPISWRLSIPRNPRLPGGFHTPPKTPLPLGVFHTLIDPRFQEGVSYPPRPPLHRGCSIPPTPRFPGAIQYPRNPRFIGGSPYSHWTPVSQDLFHTLRRLQYAYYIEKIRRCSY